MLPRRTLLAAAPLGALTVAFTPAHAVTYADVRPGSLFYTEVTWATKNNLIIGYPDGSFRPNEPVDRQTFARAVYAYRSKPSYTPPAKSYFSDVPATHLYYKEINWLVEQGITSGYWDKTFRPTKVLERNALAAFLYRMAGEPHYTPPVISYFTDVLPAEEFYKEISWLRDMNITTGWANGSYQPLEATSRHAVCAFLYRYHQNVGY
ncbi:MAG: S-layer homology domain-containing protein [Rothia sp. (in: high G+C Gram-positive bacteria)]|nr:S-layer homology domain-containing protein [Rothia sp. (in: high G+C Gram-positive bacteria)]